MVWSGRSSKSLIRTRTGESAYNFAVTPSIYSVQSKTVLSTSLQTVSVLARYISATELAAHREEACARHAALDPSLLLMVLAPQTRVSTAFHNSMLIHLVVSVLDSGGVPPCVAIPIAVC